jgi:DNA replication protein DnaC
MYESVQGLAGKLRLNGIYHGLSKRVEEAVASSLHPAEFLKLLLEDEQLARRNAHAQALTRRAKFPSQCDLENWDQSKPRGVTKVKLKELMASSYFHRKENLIIRGPTGVGKTHLAIALGRILCQSEVSVSFWSVNILFEQLQAEKAAGKYLAALTRIAKVDVIILDDFGLRNYTHDEAIALLEILEERYAKGIVIITSQVEPGGWKTLFQDSVISDAIIDRLNNPSENITLTGESFRKNRKAN